MLMFGEVTPYPPHPRRDGALYYLVSTQKAKCTTKNAFFSKILFIWTTIREEKACLRQKVNGYLVLYAYEVSSI